jgi:hypothetical protein
MDLLWQINYGEMLSGLIATTFIILLNASVVVVCSMVMFPLIDLAFKKKAKPTPRSALVETWQHDCLTAHAELSGQPWLALRSDFVRPDAVPHPHWPPRAWHSSRSSSSRHYFHNSIADGERFRGRADRSCHRTVDPASLKQWTGI